MKSTKRKSRSGMHRPRPNSKVILITEAAIAAFAAWVFTVAAQAREQAANPAIAESGQSVTGAYEGWYPNADGTYSMLIGYFNRNSKETFDVPVGPNNRIEPGGPDQGQPTHFLPRRQWGVFTITVPKDF